MKTIFTLTRQGFVFLVFLFLVQNSFAQVCSSPNTVIYGLDANGKVYPITVSPSVSEGSAMNTPPSGANQANALGYNSVNSTFYYWLAEPGSPGKFVSYKPGTGVSTSLSTTGGPSTTIHSGCVSSNGLGYYCLDVNGNLYYYNISLNTWTFITNSYKDQSTGNPITTFSTLNTGDMAIDGNGNLWFIAAGGTGQYALYELKAPLPTSAVASLTLKTIVAPTNYPSPLTGDIYGIAFNSTGQMYISASDNTLYKFNNNHTFTLLGTMSGSSITDLTSCSFPTGVLPVTWISFKATEENNNEVKLAWEVTNQIENAGYYVEFSHDNRTWNEVSFLPAKGNTADVEDYNYIFTNSLSGDNYFRIRQVDLDGHFHYSTVEHLTIGGNSRVSLWPNPARSQLNIDYENKTDGTAQVRDLSGRMIETISLHPGINQVNIESLPAGIYVVSVNQPNGSPANQRLIKQ